MNTYRITRIKEKEYANCYSYNAKNEYGQLLRCEAFVPDEKIGCWPANTFNFAFRIQTKRKHKPADGTISGRGGLGSLLWAKECLLDFISFTRTEKGNKYKGYRILVSPATRRLQKIYEHYLVPIGFKKTYSRFHDLLFSI